MSHTSHLTHGVPAEGDPHRIIVLRYRIAGRAPQDLIVSRTPDPATALRRHLELLDRWGFTLISLSDYRLFLKGELHLPRKPLILTFDDGARGLLPVLASAFREIGGRAVLFVMSRSLEAGRADASAGPRIHSEHLSVLTESGIEIGSLTRSGRPLPSLPLEIAAHELSDSKETLEELLEAPVHSCAYPADAVTPDIKKLVIKAGYDFAVGGPDGPAVFGTDLYEIRRQPVSTMTSPIGLALRVFNPHERIKRMHRKSFARLVPVFRPIRIPAKP